MAGVLEAPHDEPKAYALLSHCFTCSKDYKALVGLSRMLAARGIAVLRYDFSGLGDSEGTFAETNFTTNCDDLVSAAEFLARNHQPPQLLMGLSLGGTASVVAADRVPSADAIVTIASPSSTTRLANLLVKSHPEIISQGSALVSIGGKSRRITEQLISDLQRYDIETEVAKLRLPILMFHSPQDETLPYEWGLRMFQAAQSSKSFITLDGADHLLINQQGDVRFVASIILPWVARYLRAENPSAPGS